MPPAPDSAILKALKLDAGSTTIASHGGSGFSSTAKLTSKVRETSEDGEEVEVEKIFFVKLGKGKESEIMFAGESLSVSMYPVTYLCSGISRGINETI
jgi:protein-ribulosamine 3-kinase